MQGGAALRLLKASITDAAWAGAIAAVLALPLLGFRLVDSAQGLSLGYRLSWVAGAAAAVFAGRLALFYARLAGLKAAKGADPLVAASARLKAYAPRGRLLHGLAVVLVVCFALGLPWFSFADRNLVDRATLILIYVMLGTGLNIVVGLAGLLDLGYAAFYAVGAYSYALLSQHFGLSFWQCLPLAGLLAASFGLVLGFPVLRLRGDYLAIVTLGFGEIVHVVLVNWTPVTGGPNGIGGIPRPSFFGLPFAAGTPEGGISFAQYFHLAFSPVHRVYFLYYLILAMVLMAGALVWRLRRLALGRAWEALREDEIACRSLGLNPTMIKLSAFALGASFAGLAGAFFAARQGFVSPESFTFLESAIVLAIVVLGGMRSQLGIAAAAVLIVGLPEWFRDLAQYRMVAFGAAMVLVTLWRPRGLAGRRAPTLRLPKPIALRAAEAEVQ
jgi:branched-chain amino acid transport system permease protein